MVVSPWDSPRGWTSLPRNHCQRLTGQQFLLKGALPQSGCAAPCSRKGGPRLTAGGGPSTAVCIHDRSPDCQLPCCLHFLGTLQTGGRPTGSHLHTHGGWDPWERAGCFSPAHRCSTCRMFCSHQLIPVPSVRPLLLETHLPEGPPPSICCWGRTPLRASLPVSACQPDPESTVGPHAWASRVPHAPAKLRLRAQGTVSSTGTGFSSQPRQRTWNTGQVQQRSARGHG